jgi:hypothetical protein
LYQKLGVDYGDVVLFDGAPIVQRDLGGQTVPVFPHLTTLWRGEWRLFRFAARQGHDGQVAELTAGLPGGAELYVHTERFRILCQGCWERREQHTEHERESHSVVTGKLCMPPDVDPATVLQALDQQLPDGVEVYIPDLVRWLERPERATADQQRFDLLVRAQLANDA